MKKLIVILLSVFFLFQHNSFARAQSSWVINNFDSTITVNYSGRVSIHEVIDADFNSAEKHGIYRDIPIVYEDSSGNKTYTTIDVQRVEQDGRSAKYKLTNNDAYLRIRIGDANTTLTGPHTYTITYEATGVLRSFNDYDELYWNVTGNKWEAPIEKATARVRLGVNILRNTCFEGYAGSTSPCSLVETSRNESTFANTTVLNPGDGLTIVVGYEPGVIPILIVPPPKSITDDIGSVPSILAFFIGLVGGLGIVFMLWWKQGRDYWSRVSNLLGKSDTSEIKPLGAHETVVVEFESPDKLRPAELGVLLDERADTLDVTATIIDLAGRGYLTITEVPKKWIFGSTDYTLEKKNADREKLLPYEKLLLDNLFTSADTVKLSSLKKTFYDDLAEVKKALYRDIIDKKLFFKNPETTRTIYLGVALGMFILGGLFIFIGATTIVAPLLTFGIGFFISAIVMIFVSRFMPRRTAYGRDIYRRAKGFREFIDGAEQYRQQFFEKKNLFNDLLPYTIIFGLTDKFAKAMKDIGVEQKQPVWYSGSRPFNSAVFASDINSFSKSLSSAMASTPSSSGGFSSGGGFSGGGFGGGGGGSW